MKYLITAGGTGGHIYPALYLAQELVSTGHEVKFIASNRDVDHLILDEITEFEVLFYKMDGLNRERSFEAVYKNFRNIFLALNVSYKANLLLKKYQPDFVIGFGGFISFPIVNLARKKKITTAIHEQNSYPGLVNRKLAPIVDHVFYTYKSSCAYFSEAQNLVFTSNPRGGIVSKYENIQRAKNDILLVGGSLGADKINQLGFLLAEQSNFNVTLICGERFYQACEAQTLPKNLTLLAYSKDLVKLFKQSQLVIARAGATSLIELVYSNTLTIAIPSPNVAANHQVKNAKELYESGVLEYILEEQLSIELLLTKINQMIDDQSIYYNNMLHFSNVDSVALMQKELLNG